MGELCKAAPAPSRGWRIPTLVLPCFIPRPRRTCDRCADLGKAPSRGAGRRWCGGLAPLVPHQGQQALGELCKAAPAPSQGGRIPKLVLQHFILTSRRSFGRRAYLREAQPRGLGRRWCGGLTPLIPHQGSASHLGDCAKPRHAVPRGRSIPKLVLQHFILTSRRRRAYLREAPSRGAGRRWCGGLTPLIPHQGRQSLGELCKAVPTPGRRAELGT